MSVIVRDASGLIKMYVKGADSIIRARLRTDTHQPFLATIDASLEEFSLKGLRTLCLAMKVISEAEYAAIKQSIAGVIGSPNAEAAIKNLAEGFERDLMLLGGTAVEDRLQDNVPAVLRDFLKANINVWMLTGDKLETAENIARSCNLITKNMGVVYIRGTDTGQNKIQNQLHKLVRTVVRVASQHNEGLALVVEGESLSKRGGGG